MAKAHRSRLVTEAALVDARAKEHGDRLEVLAARLEHQEREAETPLARAEARRARYRVTEAAGALRYSAVTGSDDSDL